MAKVDKVKLSVSNLNLAYETKNVLNNISFDVIDGEFLSILGPSGCGKTTLLKVLIGLVNSDTGTIIKNGVDITHLPPSKRGMGIVFQNYALFENMSVLGNVEYSLKIKKETKAKARVKALDIIEHMGLTEHLKKRPNMLSGGQQQRVAIARTLVLEPEIILFDEPMSALDVDTRLALRKVIKDVQSKFKTTMVYITHDQEEAFAMSDRVIVMEEAKISQIDTPSNIIQNPANEYVTNFVISNIQEKIDSLSKYSVNQ